MALAKHVFKIFNYSLVNLRTQLAANNVIPSSRFSLWRSSLLSRSGNVCLLSPKVLNFSTSSTKFDLMEFFEDPKLWGETEIKSGRSWRKEELRIKSNSDLHKLWYVLLKERNVLLTTQEEYKRAAEAMPNPERIDKVEESMKNLESVVRERNRAYHLLETGHDGERPTQLVEDVLGIHRFYRLREYHIPHWMNTKWRKNYKFNYWDPKHVVEFKRLMRERALKTNARRRSIYKRYIKQVLLKYPHVSNDAINEKFPDVDVSRARKELEKFYVPEQTDK